MSKRIVPVERDGEARQSLCGALRLRQIVSSEYDSRPKVCRREGAIAVWEITIEVESLAKEVFGQLIVIRGGVPEMPQTALIGGPGIEVSRMHAHGALSLGRGDGRGNRDRCCLCNVVLHHKNVGEVAVVTLGPDMLASLGLDQLRGDADAVGGLTEAAFEHVAYTQFAPDLLHVDGAGLAGEAGVAGDDEQRGIARQSRDYVLCYPVREELLIGVVGHIGKREHRNRWLIG